MGKHILHIKLTDSQFEELQKKATKSNLSIRKYTINSLGLNCKFRIDYEFAAEAFGKLPIELYGSKFEYHGRN